MHKAIGLYFKLGCSVWLQNLERMNISLNLKCQVSIVSALNWFELYVTTNNFFINFIFSGACPLLCGGHGDYINGECECHPGWKGRECSLRHDECEVSDCSGRGHCQDGKCICMQGFTGEFCEQGNWCPWI